MKQNYPILYAIAGVVVMLFAGFVYAWSILSAPIATEFPEWTTSQLSLAFTICMAFFCLGGLIAGVLSQRMQSKWILRIACVLFLAGFTLTSRINSLPMLYLGYGVLCGGAAGLVYNSVMATVTRWFPNSQGAISGVLLMGFGASSMVIGGGFAALTPDLPGAWRTSVFVMGVLLAVVVAVCSLLIKQRSQEMADKQDKSMETRELKPKEMLTQKSFWLFFIWVVLLSVVGLVVISQARMLIQSASIVKIPLGTLSLLVGLLSICNGLGRVVFGALFDKIGRRATMIVITLCGVMGIALLILSLQLHALPVLISSFALIGFCYGGGPTMSAAFTKEFYGKRYYSMNLSVMTLSLLVGSFGSALITMIYDRCGQNFIYISALLVGMLLLAFFVQLFIPAQRKG